MTDQSRGPTDRSGPARDPGGGLRHAHGRGDLPHAGRGARPRRRPTLTSTTRTHRSLEGVSDELVFFDGATIALEDGLGGPGRGGPDRDGAVRRATPETLFPDGFHVGVRTEGGDASSTSPSRPPTRVGSLPTAARSSTCAPGRRRQWRTTPHGPPQPDRGAVAPLHARRVPRRGHVLGGRRADPACSAGRSVARAHQVVTCELPALACEAVSPVYRSDRGLTTGLRLEATDIVGADQGP